MEPSGSHTGSLTQQRESHAASHTWLFPLKGKEWQMRALGAHVVREEGLHRETSCEETAAAAAALG